MIGAIAGDIIGSVYEGSSPQGKEFPLFVPGSTFTDDTVMTVAIASAFREGLDVATSLRTWGRRYPYAGYGGWFYDWLHSDDSAPYDSFGNGSAMRVSSIGWAFNDLESVLRGASESAKVTHNHPEGIKGAQAVAAAVFLARSGVSKDGIAGLLAQRFGYDCTISLTELRSRNEFDVTCQGTVPAAAVAFIRSINFEDAVRNAVSLGGDADTLACIAGAMAEAYYGGVPDDIQRDVLRRLDQVLREEVIAWARHYSLQLIDDWRATDL